jgi:GT2 family glycosyltransferase
MTYTCAAFEQATIATVRDDGSRQFMIELGIDPAKITVTADPVFGMPALNKELALKRIRHEFTPKSGRPLVGVTLRAWKTSDNSGEAWISEIAGALDRFIDAYDADILCIPFEQVRGTDRDDTATHAETLAGAMRHADRVHTLTGRYSGMERAGIVGACDVVLAMRLHAVIMAANAGVPIVGLSYARKVDAALGRLGLADYVVDFATTTAEALYQKLSAAYQNRGALSAQIRARLPELSQAARHNAVLAVQLLNSPVTLPTIQPTTLALIKRATLTLAERLAVTTPSPVDQQREAIQANQIASMQATIEQLTALIDEKQAELSRLQDQIKAQSQQVEDALKQANAQLRTSQHSYQTLRGTVASLQTDNDALRRDLDQANERFKRVVSTRAWKAATVYWVRRDQAKRLLYRPFVAMVRGARGVYHRLIPVERRLEFRRTRWRLMGKLEKPQQPMPIPNYAPTPAPPSPVQYTPAPIQQGRRTFFIFGTVPYYDVGGGQRSAQFAKTFTKLGYNVVYLYAHESSDGTTANDAHIPAILHRHISAINPRDLIPLLHAAPVFIFEAPYPSFLPFVELARTAGATIIYEQIDNWNSALGSMFYRDEVLRQFLAQADVLVATARTLIEQMREVAGADPALGERVEKTLYLPNAVDVDLFDATFPRSRPADLVIGAPTLLFFGSLWGDWLNWELIAACAAKLPGAAFNLIGDYASIPERVAQMPPNVHFLGLKVQRDLPAYLLHSDIAMMPFRENDISKYVSPVKIFEYIAMGKPVLSTHLPDIVGYPGVVIARTPDGWAEFIRDGWRLWQEPAARIAQQQAFTLDNSWYARADALLKSAKPHMPTISIIVLNRNNRNVIFRCVNSLFQFRGEYDYEVIVVDNQSSDGSYEMLRDDTRLRVLRNTVNGCSTGRNLGAQHAKGELLVFLDSDQWVVSEGWLDLALELLDLHRNIGAVARNAGWFERGSVIGPISQTMPNDGMPPHQLYRTDVAYLSTAGMVMRRALFEHIEGFDPAYDPTCYEDTDLSLKVRHAGFELAHCPFLPINHLPHQTTNSGSPGHTALMERNGAYFAQKWNARNPALLDYWLE